MAPLKFSFQKFANELVALNRLGKKFLSRTGREQVLPAYIASLEAYREMETEREWKLEIPLDRPLRTTVSDGEYEVGGGGGRRIYAKVSSLWIIQRIPPTKKSRPASEFRLSGLASTRVRILERADNGSGDQEIAMWRMEIGDDASPGCHFHVQVLGDVNVAPFPADVPIPRLPSPLITPAAIVEFVLGELFQDQWVRELQGGSADIDRWRSIQRHRYGRLLDWQRKILGRSSTPWLAVKTAKPSPDLFVQ